MSRPDWEGATEAKIREVAAVEGLRESAIFVVASRAMHTPHEILVLDPRAVSRPAGAPLPRRARHIMRRARPDVVL